MIAATRIGNEDAAVPFWRMSAEFW